jgi:hypothetical protein
MNSPGLLRLNIANKKFRSISYNDKILEIGNSFAKTKNNFS